MSVLSNPGHHPLAIAPLAITPPDHHTYSKGNTENAAGGKRAYISEDLTPGLISFASLFFCYFLGIW